MNKALIGVAAVAVAIIAGYYLFSTRTQAPTPAPDATSTAMGESTAPAMAPSRPSEPAPAAVAPKVETAKPSVSAAAAVTESPEKEAQPESAEPKDADTELDSIEDVKAVASALESTQYLSMFQGKGPFTLLAPIDKAFDELPGGGLTELKKPENEARLKTLMENHILTDWTPLENRADGSTLTTYLGENYVLDKKNMTIGPAKILKADVVFEDGYIYFIDRVLVPPAK